MHHLSAGLHSTVFQGTASIIGPEWAGFLQIHFEEAEIGLGQETLKQRIDTVVVEDVHKVHAAVTFIHIAFELLISIKKNWVN